MNRAIRRSVGCVLSITLFAALAGASNPAQARVFVGVGLGGFGPVWEPGYPGYVVPPPVYYPPPPPPPVYYAPPPPAYAPSSSIEAPPYQPTARYAPGDCQEYTSTQIIAGSPQKVTGTACRQPDGSWRIVQ